MSLLIAEHVMVNYSYLSRVVIFEHCIRPVVDLPITQMLTWHTVPSYPYLWCATLLLRSCTFGNFAQLRFYCKILL